MSIEITFVVMFVFFSLEICWNQKISADFVHSSVELFNVWTGMSICKVTRPRHEMGDILVIQTLEVETRPSCLTFKTETNLDIPKNLLRPY